MKIYYFSKYRLYGCHFCLCEVCTRRYCKYSRLAALFDFCKVMRGREICPVLKCDFFEHKEKVRVWKVRRKGKSSKKNMLFEKLDEICKKIDKLPRV